MYVCVCARACTCVRACLRSRSRVHVFVVVVFRVFSRHMGMKPHAVHGELISIAGGRMLLMLLLRKDLITGEDSRRITVCSA